jgi:hypothetical protein
MQIRDQSGFEAIWLQCFLGAPMGHSKAEKAKTHKRLVLPFSLKLIRAA